MLLCCFYLGASKRTYLFFGLPTLGHSVYTVYGLRSVYTRSTLGLLSPRSSDGGTTCRANMLNICVVVDVLGHTRRFVTLGDAPELLTAFPSLPGEISVSHTRRSLAQSNLETLGIYAIPSIL